MNNIAKGDRSIVRRTMLILAGLFLGSVSIAVGMFSITMFLAPEPDMSMLYDALGIFMVLLCFWVLTMALRLILDRPNRGGLMSPTALLMSGGFFLLMPIAGLFDGYYVKHGLYGLYHAVGSLSTGSTLLLMARWRSRHPR